VEQQLLSAAIRSRAAYDYLESHSAKVDLSAHAQVVFTEVGEYYATDESAQCVSVTLLKERIRQKHPKYYDYFASVLDDLPQVSTENVLDLWLAAKRQSVGMRLAEKLTSGGSERDINELIDEYQFYQNYAEEEEAGTYVGVSPLEFIQEGRSQLIPIYPEALNRAIGGGAERGSNVAVFGVPEVGKTQFVINAVARIVQEGTRVLYCCNEEPAEMMVRRFVSRLSDVPSDQIRTWLQNKERAPLERVYEMAMSKGYSNLILPKDFGPGTISQVRSLIEKHEPDVVVVDQIRNLDIPGTNGYTDILDAAAKQMRDMGKRYGVTCISVTQAGDEVQGRAVLHYRDVQYSKVGFAGPFDLMIGVGATKDMQNLNQLCMSVSKNKFNGKHVSVMGRVSRQTSKIKSL